MSRTLLPASVLVALGLAACQPDTALDAVEARSSELLAPLGVDWDSATCGVSSSKVGCSGTTTTTNNFGSTVLTGSGDGEDPIARLIGSIGGQPVVAVMPEGDTVYLLDGKKALVGTLEGLKASPVAVVLADADGDGGLDAVVADAGGRLTVFDAVAAGTNLAAASYAVGSSIDALASSGDRVHAAVDGKHLVTLGASGLNATSAAGITDVATADVDGDGAHELVVAQSGGIALADATKVPSKLVPSQTGLKATSVALGDVGGMAAILAGSPATGSVHVLKSSGAHVAALKSAAAGFGTDVATGDLDGDGLGEVVAGAPGDGEVHIVWAEDVGSGSIDAAATVVRSTGLAFGAEVVASDLDGDGVDELASGASVFNLGL